MRGANAKETNSCQEPGHKAKGTGRNLRDAESLRRDETKVLSSEPRTDIRQCGAEPTRLRVEERVLIDRWEDLFKEIVGQGNASEAGGG